jgi:hypothetical protein
VGLRPPGGPPAGLGPRTGGATVAGRLLVEDDVKPAAKLLVRQQADLGAAGGGVPRAAGGGVPSAAGGVHGTEVAGGRLRAADLGAGARGGGPQRSERRERSVGLSGGCVRLFFWDRDWRPRDRFRGFCVFLNFFYYIFYSP